MADVKKHQNELDRPHETARQAHGDRAGASQARDDAQRQAGTPGIQTAREGSRIASEAARRTAATGTAGMRSASDVGPEAGQRGVPFVVDAQQRLVEDAADQVKEAGRKLAETIQQTAEDLRSLMPLPAIAGDGLEEIRDGLGALIEGTARANLRVTQELLRLVNPNVVINLQQRFAREYLGALVEGQAAMLRAARHAADQALRPVEQRLQQRRRMARGGGQAAPRQQTSRVADVMNHDVRVASPEDTVQQAACVMREQDAGVLPVGENDRLVGMVTDRDVALRLVAEGKDPARTRVREVMTPEVRYVFEDADLHQAAETMAEQQVRRLPVLSRNKRLVGVVSLGDLAAAGRTSDLAGHALAGITREGGRHDQAAAE